jgi:hypothetical protein
MEDYVQKMPKVCLKAFEEISRVGAAQGHKPHAWRNELASSHVIKAVGHLMDFLLGRVNERHLYHAMWRVCVAVAIVNRLAELNVKECLSYKPTLTESSDDPFDTVQ